MDKPKIISITYAIQLSEDIIKKISIADKKGYGNLRNKLRKRNEVKEVNYGKHDSGNDVKITILFDSVTNPDKNQKYWEEIADIISDHIWGVKNV